MKTLVIYHRADFDGIFCREIARKFLGDEDVIYTGWDYGDSDAIVPPGIERIYMLDISVDTWMNDGRLVWIDHHKTAIEKFGVKPGCQIDGVAACRLAWQWFFSEKMPIKQDFIDRKLVEPKAVRLAGEYDIWDKRDPDAELFQHGLKSQELTASVWSRLLSTGSKKSIREIEEMIDVGHPFDLRPDGTVDDSISTVGGLLNSGRVIQYVKAQENESIIKAAGFTVKFDGLTFLACNHARYNSFLFTAGLKPEHDACLGFAWRDGQWTVSLYHAPGKEHHDLSEIAKSHGGGGHRGACGFRVKTLPFLS